MFHPLKHMGYRHAAKRGGYIGTAAHLAKHASKAWRSYSKKSQRTKHEHSHSHKHDVKVTQSGDQGHAVKIARVVISKPNHFMSHAVKQAPPNTIQNFASGQIQSSIGRQSVNLPTSGMDKPDLDTITLSLSSGLSTPMTYDAAQEKRVWIESFQQQWELCSGTSVPIEVEIYICTPKQNTVKDPLVAMQDGIRAKFFLDTTSQEINIPFMTPNDSSDFRILHKVLAKKHIMLSPGQVYKLHIHRDIKRFYDDREQTGGNTFFKHLTQQVIFIVRGTVVMCDGGTDRPTYSPATLGWAVSQRFKFRFPSYPVISKSNYQLGAPPIVGTGVFMEEDTGVEQQVKQVT